MTARALCFVLGCSTLLLSTASAVPLKLAVSGLSLDVPANLSQRNFSQNGIQLKLGMDLDTEMVVLAMSAPINGPYAKISEKQLVQQMLASFQTSSGTMKVIKQGPLNLNGQNWAEMQAVSRNSKGQDIYVYALITSKKASLAMVLVACEVARLEQNRALIGRIVGSVKL